MEKVSQARPRSIILDDVTRGLFKSVKTVPPSVPKKAPDPVSPPVPLSALATEMAQVAQTPHPVAPSAGSLPNEEEEEVEPSMTNLPDNGVYTLVGDMTRFLEEEGTEQRIHHQMSTLMSNIRAASDIVYRLDRAAHTEKNWELAKAVLRKAGEHLANLSLELDGWLLFNKKRARNIERLVQRGTAVAAGGIPTMPDDADLANTGEDFYMFNFNNDTLAPYAATETLTLSTFETSQ